MMSESYRTTGTAGVPVWILEDDAGVQLVYEHTLAERYRVRFFASISAFASALTKAVERPSLVIADIRLQDGSFLDFLTDPEARALLRIPFIVVTSFDDMDILRVCIDEGAFDYMTKPFGKSALLFKIESVLARQVVVSEPVELVAEFVIDSFKRTIARQGGAAIDLTTREMQILTSLMQSAGQRIERPALSEAVWGGMKVGAKTLDVHIFNLRRKLLLVGYEIRFRKPATYELVPVVT